jgi:hypothetical protein
MADLNLPRFVATVLLALSLLLPAGAARAQGDDLQEHPVAAGAGAPSAWFVELEGIPAAVAYGVELRATQSVAAAAEWP